MKAATSLRQRLPVQAEGTGVEPATPYGAVDFESDAICPETLGKLPVSGTMGANAGAVETKREHQDPDLQAIIDAWPNLPDAVKAGIVAMVRTASGVGRAK